MPRLKLSRFRAPQPAPELLAQYLEVVDLKTLHFAPDTLPPLSPARLFGDDRPMSMDLGCGRGDFLRSLAAEHPDAHYLGFDLHWKSLWYAISRAYRADLHNIKFVRTDLRGALRLVPDRAVREAFMLFPPPRTEPNRQQEDLLPADTLRQLQRVLIPGGLFHFVTDDPLYFEQKLALIRESGLFTEPVTSRGFEGGMTWFQNLWEKMERESLRLECAARE